MGKKILLCLTASGVVIAEMAVAFLGAAQTNAHNLTEADKLTLKISDTCQYNGGICVLDRRARNYFWKGTRIACACSWVADELDKKIFFNLSNIMPGDWGVDAASVRVSDDSWMCLVFDNVTNFENGCNDPEMKAGDISCHDPGPGEGELQKHLLFTIWRDKNCNNALDANNGEQKQVLIKDAPIENGIWPIADSKIGTGSIKSDKTYCLGISWKLPSDTGNDAQGDKLMGDIKFVAIQAKNNLDYVCGKINVCHAKSEICDGIDNDCDGRIDDGPNWNNKGRSCHVGQGICQRFGTYICDARHPLENTICSAKEDKSCCDPRFDRNCKNKYPYYFDFWGYNQSSFGCGISKR